MRKYILLVIAGLFVLITPPTAYFLSGKDSGKPAQFVIEKGDGLREIGHSLYEAGIIKSPPAFILYSAFSGSGSLLKSGMYQLDPSMSVPTISRILHAGPKEDITVLVVEGESLAEIEKSLVDKKIIKPRALSKFPGRSLEGFLFPDTYRFFPDSSTGEVVKKFFSNFYKQAIPVLKNSKMNFYDTLILASIIEKEVPHPEERRVVSGVLYKRMRIGMALQVDAAPETYDRPGLPARPIGNPGLDATKAAVYPQESEYLYYLSDPKTDKTIFSKTFDEHVQNKFRYLR